MQVDMQWLPYSALLMASQLPGTTIVCGDSHTTSKYCIHLHGLYPPDTHTAHGAFGSLAFGIGTSAVEHVLATQCLALTKSRNMRVTIDGALPAGVAPKDVVLHIIGVLGAGGATGCVVEFAGPAVRAMSMEARMSVCNMSVEAGARAGLVAPDEVTVAYLRGRPLAPRGGEWDRAVKYWQTLRSDEGARFDVEVTIHAEDIGPTVTWGTSPQDVVSILGSTPDPAQCADIDKRRYIERALAYMGLAPNMPMQDIPIDKVFIGSCTNGRIEDLREAARVVRAAGPDARVRDGVHAMVVPGSGLVKARAEAEGLDAVFTRAGFDWREPGCSLCCGLADTLGPGERCASTSNRNFEGRQGPRSRTHLLSPAMAAAAALRGKLTDVREFLSRAVDVEPGPALELVPGVDIADETIPDVPSMRPHPIVQHEKSGRGAMVTGAAVVAFERVKGIAAPLHLPNVDTDVIFPAQFCKTLKRTGLADYLFFSVRNDIRSGTKTDFVLNRPPYTDAKILVCDMPNFGCGSSREHAAWAM